MGVQRPRPILALLAVLALGCESPSGPTGDPFAPRPPTRPTYRDVSGCIGVEWAEGNPYVFGFGSECIRYTYRFVNACGFDVGVAAMDNAHGRTKAEVDQEAATYGRRATVPFIIGPNGATNWGFVDCPGGNAPYITWCAYDPNQDDACVTWTVD